MSYSDVWKDKSEEDVLACLEEAYLNAGFAQVINWHKIDRAHEESVDLECINPNNKVTLQAKIKPGKNDIPQLIKLSLVEATKRIYVYIEKPAASFKLETEKLKDIDFFDSKGLHNLLIKYRSTRYLRYLLLSSDMVKNISRAVNDIISCKKIVPHGIKPSNLEDWWMLKDRSVKIHASLEYLNNYWNEIIFRITEHNEETYKDMVSSILKSFEIISCNSAKDLSILVKQIKESCPNILSEYTQVVLARSNWMDLIPIKYETFDKMKVVHMIDNWIVPQPKGFSEYLEISEYLKNLMYVSEAIEDGVDWLFDDFLKAQNLRKGKNLHS